MASGGLDGTVRVWDADTGAELLVLREDTAWRQLSFSPDGRRLVGVTWAGGVWIWDAPPGGG